MKLAEPNPVKKQRRNDNKEINLFNEDNERKNSIATTISMVVLRDLGEYRL